MGFKAASLRVVSIHAPARGATLDSVGIFPSDPVSIHAPARGATMSMEFIRMAVMVFQSTLPRGERLPPQQSTTTIGSFNPRSRAGSDRMAEERSSVLPGVSIHAPARGATQKSTKAGLLYIVFQSTLPRGERPSSLPRSTKDGCFNPRSRAGSD